MKLAYVMSRFPRLSETFVLGEMLAVEELGVDVDLYPLLREREDIVHPEAEALARRAHYLPFLSLAILRSQVHFLCGSRAPTWGRWPPCSAERGAAGTSSSGRSGSSRRSPTPPA